MDSFGLIATARALTQGADLAGKELKGSPRFFIGAAVNPGAAPMELQVMQTIRKMDAGARFFQTQVMYDVWVLERFVNLLAQAKGPARTSGFYGGYFPFKSAKQARFFNEKVPGVHVPAIIEG